MEILAERSRIMERERERERNREMLKDRERRRGKPTSQSVDESVNKQSAECVSSQSSGFTETYS